MCKFSLIYCFNFHSQMKSGVVLLLILCISYQNAECFRFLAILPVTSKSHYYIGHNLMKGLAEDGHDVTVISPFKVDQPIKNYNEVFLEHSWEISRKSKWFLCSLKLLFEMYFKHFLFLSSSNHFAQLWQRIISKRIR